MTHAPDAARLATRKAGPLLAVLSLSLAIGLAQAQAAEATDAPGALARCLGGQAEPGELVAVCGEALDGEIDDASRVAVLVRRAGVRFRGGQSDAAIADIGQAITLAPDNATAWRARGMMRNARFEYALAVADLDKALELAPGDVGALRHRAHAHAALGKHALAVADLDAALAGQPDIANDLYDRGLSHAALRQFDSAAADFNRAIALAPDYAGEFPPACVSRDEETGKARLSNWPACED